MTIWSAFKYVSCNIQILYIFSFVSCRTRRKHGAMKTSCVTDTSIRYNQTVNYRAEDNKKLVSVLLRKFIFSLVQ